MLIRVELCQGADLVGFRRAVRSLAAQQIAPERVTFAAGTEQDLLSDGSLGDASDNAPPLLLPRAIGALVESVVCHCEPQRYALLYGLIWRVLHGERSLLEVPSDPLVHRLEAMRKAVGRDIHKMHAFLRFREDAGFGR